MRAASLKRTRSKCQRIPPGRVNGRLHTQYCAHPKTTHSPTPAQMAQPTRLTEHTAPHDAAEIGFTPFDFRQSGKHDSPKSCTSVEAQPQPFKRKFASLAFSLVESLSLRMVRPKLLAVRRSS